MAKSPSLILPTFVFHVIRQNVRFSNRTTFFICFVLLLAACNPSRKLADNQHLLVRQKVVLEGNQKGISSSDLDDLVKQRPNRKMLGVFPFKLWMYNLIDKGRPTGFNNWLRKSFGEKPAIYDPMLTSTSVSQIRLYLDNRGYFNSSVVPEVLFEKKKAYLKYLVKPASPYYIRKLEYSSSDSILNRVIKQEKSGSLIIPGSNYNAFSLDEERNRLTNVLQNNGYYEFTREHIYYEIDSALNSHQLDVWLKVKQKKVLAGDSLTFVENDHERYRISRIFINPAYKPFESTDAFDTVVEHIYQVRKSRPTNSYYFLNLGKAGINPKTLTQATLISDRELFNLKDVNLTYKQLSGLRVFRYVNIRFERAPVNADTMQGISNLDCMIDLTRAPVQSFSIGTEGTNSGGDLGIGGNFIYQNKNLFHGAEILRIKLTGAVEAQKVSGEETSEVLNFFNTFETGAELSIDIPKFLIPVRQERFPKYFRPKTSVTSGVNYQNRPKYKRYISNISFGFTWNESDYKTHILYPADINAVSMFPTPELEAELQGQNPRLVDQYTDHIISALKYSFIFNNQQINKYVNFLYFRGNFESAGNALNLTRRMINSEKNEEGKYTLFNIRYSQYIKANTDVRIYRIFNPSSSLVYRIFAGVGIPYGNSDALPFEKGYYAGGANGMRGWQLRSLGPGAFHAEDDNLEKTGEIQLEANIEYRFPLSGMLKGAFFADAGNVWLLKSNEKFPDGEFNLDTFTEQIALDGGFGFRFDFNFFIFRIDAALPFRSPYLPAGERLILYKSRLKDIAWNFGIGYPF